MPPAAPSPSAPQSQARPVLDAISVVIPTLGRAMLADCLAALHAGTAWPACVIVVDQGGGATAERELALLAEHGIGIAYVRSNQRGRAAGVNRGLERVSTALVAITDDDCLVAPEWLAALVARLRHDENQVVTGPVDPTGGDEPVISVRRSRAAAVQRRPRLTHDLLAGGNMGTSHAVLTRVGLLDEDPRLAAAEDREWAYRALRAGVPLVYAPEVVVQHAGWRDASQRAAQYASYARSHGAFYGKYLRRGDWYIAARAAVDLARSAAKYTRGLVTRDAEDRVVGRAFLLGLLPGVVAGMRAVSSKPA